jgi:nucleotide-binding universal stress UspA family protein
MFRKILVADDGSDGARRALELGAGIAACCQAELHSVTVEEELPRYAATMDEVEAFQERKEAFFTQVKAEAERIAGQHGVAIECHVIAGHEVEATIRFCTEGAFDLLLLGFMGHSRIFERVWGSTSQTLTRLAPCSVLVAK